MDQPLPCGIQLITLCQICQDARRSVHVRRQQVLIVRLAINALQIDREVDPARLAAAKTEQAARVQLAAQAKRNAAAACLRVVEAASQANDTCMDTSSNPDMR